MGKLNKTFRLNVVITYSDEKIASSKRPLFLSILNNFAWLYQLDYEIDERSQVFGDAISKFGEETDLFYYRSNQASIIERKALQNMIDQVFAYNNILSDGIEIAYQYQKYLREYPFPINFHRALNYPYVEEHRDNQLILKVAVDFVNSILTEE